MSIVKRAEKLGDAIIETAEYEKLKATEEKMYGDDEAKKILEQFQSKQNEMHQMHHKGEEITSEMQEEMQQLQQKLEANELVKEYLAVQNKFNDLMEQVNQTLSEKIYGPQQSGCGPDCGAGCC